MSPKTPPTIDLDALQDRLDGLARQGLAEPTPARADADLGAVAIEAAANGNAANGNGHALPRSQREEVDLPPVPRLGAEAAANMTKLSKAAAEDIRQLGRVAFEAGKRVQEECEQMARDVEANGGTIAVHLTGLSQLLADVGMSNRETLRRLLGGASPSIVPAAGNRAFEDTIGAAKITRTPSFAKPGRRAD